MVDIQIHVDDREFQKTFKQYMEVTSRTLGEACNQSAFDISRFALKETYAVDPTTIRNELKADSQKYDSVPLAAILINSERGKKGLKGLNGQMMADAVTKFINKRVSHRNFLKAGWIPAIKGLYRVIPFKKSPTVPKSVEGHNRNFGGFKPAKEASLSNWNPFALIWNQAGSNGKTLKYIEEGAQKALDKKVEDFKQYIERHLAKHSHSMWN